MLLHVDSGDFRETAETESAYTDRDGDVDRDEGSRDRDRDSRKRDTEKESVL